LYLSRNFFFMFKFFTTNLSA